MDVRIGLVYSGREIELELADDTDVEVLKKQIDGALGGAGANVLWLVDRKGNQVGLAADKVTYVSVGSGEGKGRIGFGG